MAWVTGGCSVVNRFAPARLRLTACTRRVTAGTAAHSYTPPSASVSSRTRPPCHPELVKLDDQGWRAKVYPSGRWHSLTSDSGTATAPDPFAAVQRAAWQALHPRPIPTPGGEEMTETIL